MWNSTPNIGVIYGIKFHILRQYLECLIYYITFVGFKKRFISIQNEKQGNIY